MKTTILSQISKLLIQIIISSFIIFSCKMPALHNPSDPFSDEYGKNVLLSELIRYWLRDKIVPDGLIVAVSKSAVPYESGFRIYRVDPDIGVTTEYDSDIRSANVNAFPGCQPVRVSVAPNSRDIITFTGSASDHIVTHRYGTDRSLNLLKDEFYSGVIPSMVAFSSDSSTMYVTDFSNPNKVQRLNRDLTSGSTSLGNGSGYPFSVGCAPISIKTSQLDNLVFAVSSSYLPIGIYSFKNTGSDSGAITSGSPYNSGSNPSQQNNLCISEYDRFLYMTSVNGTNPIYGVRYDSEGNMTALPNSPFSPDSGFTAPTSNTNYATSLAIDPQNKYLLYLYSAGGTFYIRLLVIDKSSGNLIPTDQKVSVGNSPMHLDWDKSGKFIYLISDTGGTTNKFQIEYFKFTYDGKLTKGINSPITIGAMSSDFTPRHITSIPRYY
ncbi:lactonase family protein [Leptospira levettii]|uniref:lactonase family protein n=1 Tax=Leptospira levettii TaxID=2023178 RepID=UPI001FEF2C2D|nr:lactonase family protein [Leptospira levettii]